MKRTSKKDQYFIEMLNAERKYRTAAGGEDADEPFITPVDKPIADVFSGLTQFFRKKKADDRIVCF